MSRCIGGCRWYGIATRGGGGGDEKKLLFSRAVQRSDGDVSAREAVRFAALGTLGGVWGGI